MPNNPKWLQIVSTLMLTMASGTIAIYSIFDPARLDYPQSMVDFQVHPFAAVMGALLPSFVLAPIAYWLFGRVFRDWPQREGQLPGWTAISVAVPFLLIGSIVIALWLRSDLITRANKSGAPETNSAGFQVFGHADVKARGGQFLTDEDFADDQGASPEPSSNVLRVGQFPTDRVGSNGASTNTPEFQTGTATLGARINPRWPPTVPTSQGAITLGPRSALLDQDMSEVEVNRAMGGLRPQTVELQTCGAATRNPWTCKTYRYRGSGGRRTDLQILFRQAEDGVWRVNSWFFGS